MLVYKTFLKVIKKNFFPLFINLAVFLAITFIAADNGVNNVDVFSPEKIGVAVIDRDHSDVSKAIGSFFGQTQTVVEMEDDIDELQDALFFRHIRYLLIIPAGFGESFTDGGEIQLETTRAPGSYEGVYIDMQLGQFLTTLRTYLAAGFDYKEASERTMSNLAIETEVNMFLDSGKTVNTASFTYYYQFAAYAVVAVMVHMMATIMVVFNKKDLYARMNCSAMPLRSRNIQMALGCGTMAAGVWALLIISSLLKYGESLTGSAVLPYLMGNTAAITAASLAVGFLVGNIIKHQNNVSIYSVSISLAFSFLGGVFVPLSLMSNNVLKFSRLLPTYWYIRLNDELVTTTAMTQTVKDLFYKCVSVQLAFAAVVFAAALLLSKRNSRAR